jgi:hypothetical protein
MQSISRAAARSQDTCNEKVKAEGKTTPEVRPRRADGVAVPGLVHSPTSDTAGPEAIAGPSSTIRVDRTKSRLVRLKSSVLTAARLHQESKPKWRVVMVTPTYAPDQSWESRDITRLVKCIREWLSRKGIEMRYVWVMEYTKIGKPHYHMLVWLPLGITLPYADKRGWWSKGWTNQEWARNAVGYIAKYTSKGSDLIQYRKGARHHGNGGMTGDALLQQRWWKLPAWIRPSVEPLDGARRRKGGGIVIPATGEVFQSPWEVFFERGEVFIRLKAEKPHPS